MLILIDVKSGLSVSQSDGQKYGRTDRLRLRLRLIFIHSSERHKLLHSKHIHNYTEMQDLYRLVSLAVPLGGSSNSNIAVFSSRLRDGRERKTFRLFVDINKNKQHAGNGV